MQFTELASEGLRKQFKVVVDNARIQTEMESELKRTGERIKIPGFRPGYIPMKILQQRYGKAVEAEVLQKVVNQATRELMTRPGLRPAMTPQVDIEEYKEGGDIAFTVGFESLPEIPEVDYGKITLNRQVYEIGEPDVDATVTRIAEATPKFSRCPEGTKAAPEHTLTIDFTGTVGGVAFSGGSATGFKLELGSGQFIAGFETQLVGAKEGEERQVAVTFPKDYHAQDLAGKEAVFTVKVHEIQSKSPSDIDEDFVKARGFKDLAAFRAAVRGQMAQEYDRVVRDHLKRELFDNLEQQLHYDLPQSMVDMEFNAIWQKLQQAKASGDPSVAGKTDDELKTEYTAIARRRVKLGLLLADVGGRHKLQITREEMSRAIMQQASLYPGQENKVMDFYRKNPERASDLRGPILEEKAVDFILTKVTFNDRKVTLDALANEDNAGGDDGDSGKVAPAKPAKAKAARKPAEEKSAAAEAPAAKDAPPKKPAAKKKKPADE